MAILWIVFFHAFIAYGGRYPWLRSFSSLPPFIEKCAPNSLLQKFSCAIEAVLAGLFQQGAQGVAVFLLFSGFGLTYSLVKKGGEPSWKKWYGNRLIRVFPLYWLAHIVFLFSPFQYDHYPIDYRFILSFFGDRFYPVAQMFYYLVPAWWFIGLLLQLYLVFPILYRSMMRFGSIRFLVTCIILTVAARYLIYALLEANDEYVQGAFFVCRLWEFAVGMVFGKLMVDNPSQTMKLLFSWKCLIAGFLIYWVGQLGFSPNFLYSLSDGLNAMGLSIIMIHAAARIDRVRFLGKAVAFAGTYSYGIYLFHQPYLMSLGRELIPYSMTTFIFLVLLLTALIAIASMGLERANDEISRRYFIR
jgi:peptidoglycan/LPS O-acetylase OafA/YrhL